MSQIAIQAEALGKQYRIGAAGRPRYLTLRDSLAGLVRSPRLRPRLPLAQSEDRFWALQDVSFQVERGEAVGIIGRNGAGKSTLLKILSRITRPTAGRARIVGRVGSLLEVGTGFHPELTGRENVYLNGAILGMRRAEIRRRFDQIVAFAEVERFLDTPVKHYSSGMYMRLAFAVAAHLEPQVLVVDEVLAVGDAAFQHKCLGRMQEAAEGGRTVLFISHNMGAIRSLTRRCLYLHQGRTLAFGPTGEVVDRYMHDALHQADQATGDLSYFRRGTHPDPAARFTAIRVTRPAAPAGAAEPAEPAGPGAAVARVPVREPFAVEMEIEVLRPLANPNMSLAIKREGGEAIVHLLAREGGLTGEFGRGTHVVRCLLQGLHLLPGRYAVDVGINAQVGVLAWDIVADYPAFEIANIGKGALEYRPERPGHVLCPAAAWTVLDGPRAEG